ncbi:MAG TPA: TIGR03619 family F420-dependent LLM class oxidoreductase [bacterium]|nr:TIGR03619 family F420-dependent LLM class oxidoreductase [bacterium]
MDVGVTLPTQGPLATPEAVAAIARHADASGFGSVWVTDHIAIPVLSDSRYPYSRDGRLPWDPSIPYLDALTALAWVAALTRTVRLGTSVLVLPMRHPLPVAKAVATLDYLSGGRAVLAVGAGWFEEEFALLDQPFRDRGRRLDDAVRLLRACWGPDPVRYEGAFYNLPPFAMAPKPPQGNRLPVLAGGEGDAALRRVAAVCDGWQPLGLDPDTFGERVRQLEALAGRRGRSIKELWLQIRVGRGASVTRDLAARYAEAGARTMIIDPPYRTSTLDAVHTFLDEVARELRLAPDGPGC